MPTTEERIRMILEEVSLPHDVKLRFDGVPLGTEAAYFPSEDTIALTSSAPRLTILHEGAHAEHYRRAGLAGKPMPGDWATLTGVLLASEAYVGSRLANEASFLATERSMIAQIDKGAFPKTVGAWASLYKTGSQVRGPDFDGTPTSSMGFRLLMRLLPALIAELQTGDIVLTADIENPLTVPGEAWRKIALLTAALAESDERIVALVSMRELGEAALGMLESIS